MSHKGNSTEEPMDLPGHLKVNRKGLPEKVPRNAFRQINRFVQERLISHLHRRSQRPYRKTGETSWYAHLHHLGLKPL